MSEIYYAGGTAVKDISSANLIDDLTAQGVDAHFVANRTELFQQLIPSLGANTVLLLMGARDPSLEAFTAQVNQWVAEKNN
jgi:UDP-N-acetylmuramate--alanine ligase